MLTSDHQVILRELALYTTFLAGALSPTAASTFCELLFGCMLSADGFVTQALLSIDFHGVEQLPPLATPGQVAMEEPGTPLDPPGLLQSSGESACGYW